MGQIVDGGWDVCYDYMVKYFQLCIVYLFGVLGDLIFDDEVLEIYYCDVFFFDLIIVFLIYQYGLNVWFYRIGIGNKYEKFRVGYVVLLQKF